MVFDAIFLGGVYGPFGLHDFGRSLAGHDLCSLDMLLSQPLEFGSMPDVVSLAFAYL